MCLITVEEAAGMGVEDGVWHDAELEELATSQVAVLGRETDLEMTLVHQSDLPETK